jgi:hypothetical protein
MRIGSRPTELLEQPCEALKCRNEGNSGNKIERSVKNRRYCEYTEDLERGILPHDITCIDNLAIPS